MNPSLRRKLAISHFYGSIILGIVLTVFLAKDNYDRVLLGVSFYAITITAWDVWQTSDVRVAQEEGT